MKKNISIFALLILLFITSFTFSFGIGDGLSIADYSLDKDKMMLNFSLEDTAFEPKADNTTFKIGDKEQKINNISTLKEAGISQTYIFMADVSGSLKKEDLNYLRNIMMEIVDDIDDDDSVMIYTFGTDYEKYMEVTKDRNIIEQKIKELRANDKNTNLFESTGKIITELSTNDDTNVRKNLIILSDGEEDYAKGKTPEEIYSTIESAGIPIYSVSLAKDRNTYNINKPFLSFANKSPGGMPIFALEMNASKVASEIVNSANESYIAEIDLSKFESGDQTQMTLEIPEKGYKDKKSLIQTDIEEIKNSILSKNETQKEDQEQTQENEPVAKKKKDLPLIPIIIGGVVLLVVIVLIVLLSKGKKSNGIIIELIDSSNPNNNRKRPLKGRIQIGREKSNQISYMNDKLLSSRHCSIYFENGLVYIEDHNSTNGTYVNGVKVTGPMRINDRDKLLIGSLELEVRITFS